MIIQQIYISLLIGSFPAFLHSTPLLLSFNFPARVAVHPPAIIAFTLYQHVITPVVTIIGALVNAVSRRFEFQADRFACQLHSKYGVRNSEGMGKRLGEALISIMVDNRASFWTDSWCVVSGSVPIFLLAHAARKVLRVELYAPNADGET